MGSVKHWMQDRQETQKLWQRYREVRREGGREGGRGVDIYHPCLPILLCPRLPLLLIFLLFLLLLLLFLLLHSLHICRSARSLKAIYKSGRSKTSRKAGRCSPPGREGGRKEREDTVSPSIIVTI